MLKTETNTTSMEYRVLGAFKASDLNTSESFSVVFEHGQWWIITREPERAEVEQRTFSVVDEEPGIDGFGFEEI